MFVDVIVNVFTSLFLLPWFDLPEEMKISNLKIICFLLKKFIFASISLIECNNYITLKNAKKNPLRIERIVKSIQIYKVILLGKVREIHHIEETGHLIKEIGLQIRRTYFRQIYQDKSTGKVSFFHVICNEILIL